MPSIPSGLELVARRQAAVVTRAQLIDVGIDRHMVTRRVAQGVWSGVGPRVVVLHTGDLDREQRWWAGVLHAGLANGATREAGTPTVALCGLSAAEAGGLTGFETSVVHVLVAHGRETQDLDHEAIRIRIHQTRHLEAADVHPTLSPPRLRLARAVVESASAAVRERPGRARSVIAASGQQRLAALPTAAHDGQLRAS